MAPSTLYIFFVLFISFIWSQQNYVALTLDEGVKNVSKGSTSEKLPLFLKGSVGGYNNDKAVAAGSVIYVHPIHGELSTTRLQHFVRESIASFIIKNYFAKGSDLTAAQIERFVREDFKDAGIRVKHVSPKKIVVEAGEKLGQQNLSVIIKKEAKNVNNLWNKFLVFTDYLPKRLKKINNYIKEEERRTQKKAKLYLSDLNDTGIYEQHLQSMLFQNTANEGALNLNDMQITTEEEKVETKKLEEDKAKGSVETFAIDIKRCDLMMNKLFAVESVLDKSIFKFCKTCSEKEKNIFSILKKYMRSTVASMINRLLRMRFEIQLLLEKQNCVIAQKKGKPCEKELYGQEDRNEDSFEILFDENDEDLEYDNHNKKDQEMTDYEILYGTDKELITFNEKLLNDSGYHLDNVKESGKKNEPETTQGKDINEMDRKETDITQEKSEKTLKDDAEETVDEEMKEAKVHAEVEESPNDLHEDMEEEYIKGQTIWVNQKKDEPVKQSKEMQLEDGSKKYVFKKEEEIEERDDYVEEENNTEQYSTQQYSGAEEHDDAYDKKTFQHISLHRNLEYHINYLKQKKHMMSIDPTVPFSDLKETVREVEECFKLFEMANQYVNNDIENVLQVFKNTWKEAKSKVYTMSFNIKTLENVIAKLHATKKNKILKFIDVVLEYMDFLKTYIINLQYKINNDNNNNNDEIIQQKENIENLQHHFKNVEGNLKKHKKIIHILNVISKTLNENKTEIFQHLKNSKEDIVKLGNALHEYMKLHVEIFRTVNTLERIAKVMIYHEELKKRFFDVRKIWKNYCLGKKLIYKKEKYPLLFQYHQSSNVLFPPEFNSVMRYKNKFRKKKHAEKESTDDNEKTYSTIEKNNSNVKNVDNAENTENTENAVMLKEDKENVKESSDAKFKNVTQLHETNPNQLVYNSAYFSYIYNAVLKKYEDVTSEKEMTAHFFREYRSIDAVIDIISAHIYNLKFFMKEKRKSLLWALEQKKRIIKKNALIIDKINVIKKLITKMPNVENKIKGKDFFDMFLQHYRYLINIEQENLIYIDNFVKFVKKKAFSANKWKHFLKKHKRELVFDQNVTDDNNWMMGSN